MTGTLGLDGAGVSVNARHCSRRARMAATVGLRGCIADGSPRAFCSTARSRPASSANVLYWWVADAASLLRRRRRSVDFATDREFLTSARQAGLPVWCLSNDVGRWSRTLREKLGIERLLTGAVISSDAKVRKPDRGIYEQLLVATGCRPAELLFVDDRARNVAGAAAVGIPAIEFTGPHVYQEH